MKDDTFETIKNDMVDEALNKQADKIKRLENELAEMRGRIISLTDGRNRDNSRINYLQRAIWRAQDILQRPPFIPSLRAPSAYEVVRTVQMTEADANALKAAADIIRGIE